MFSSYSNSFGSVASGSAIFGSVLPANKSKLFLSSFMFTAQDSIHQNPCSVFHAFVNAHAQMIIPQFIGVF